MLNALENEYAAANEKQESNSKNSNNNNNKNITSYKNNNNNYNKIQQPKPTTTIARSLYLSVRLETPFESLQNKSIIRFNFYSICGSALLLHWFTNPVNNLLQSIYLYQYIFIYIYVYIYSTYINFCYFLWKWLITHSDRTITITRTHTHTHILKQTISDIAYYRIASLVKYRDIVLI